jgi:hypothetical protein
MEMNHEYDNGPDDQLADLLAEYDEALGSGSPTPPQLTSPLTPDSQLRLADAQEFLQFIRRAWPRPREAGMTPLPDIGASDTLQNLEEHPAQIGRFLIHERIGRGGWGVIFRAYDPTLQREVALKVPRPEALVSEDMRQRFIREARAAGALSHPNLVPVYESGESGVFCYIASMLCNGPNLAEWLKRQSQAVPIRDAAALVKVLAEAVQHAHDRGIIHRDLKPANILLSVDSRQHTVASRKSTKDERFAPLLSTDYCLLLP